MATKYRKNTPRPHSKKVKADGYDFDSILERDFYLACKSANIKVVKANKIDINKPIKDLPFDFYAGGDIVKRIRGQQYTPDFYLPDYNYTIEIKGVDTPEFRRRFVNYLHHNANSGEHKTNVALLYNRREFFKFIDFLKNEK